MAKNNVALVTSFAIAGFLALSSVTARAQLTPACNDGAAGFPTWAQLKAALTGAQGGFGAAGSALNGGFGLHMWATIVDRDGRVCEVAFTGPGTGAQWPGSRVISAQKANTANAFSLPGLALSTANLYSAVQPGGSLFGLQESNPVDVHVAYAGSSANFGQDSDPMATLRIGGVNVFGGGLGLYNASGTLIGGIGVSGDTSCADHNVAWRTRHALNLDFVPSGVSGDPDRPDNIVYDIKSQPFQMNGVSATGWGQPHCISAAAESTIAANLPAVQ
jgi:uncharacterized protein GlcG (DUF336 family)